VADAVVRKKSREREGGREGVGKKGETEKEGREKVRKVWLWVGGRVHF
jgi:hypothetical protein